MKLITLAILLALSITSAAASDLIITLSSKHIPKSGMELDFNESNIGAIYKFDSDYFVGAFKNSYWDVSPILGKRFAKGVIGLDVGVAYYPTHYQGDNFLLPFVQATVDLGPLRVGYAPIVDKYSNGLITFQYVIKLD